MDLAVGEWNKSVALEEIEDALTEKVRNDADVTSVIKTVIQVDASISVLVVVGSECRENSQFYP